jgi:hypothetical protein
VSEKWCGKEQVGWQKLHQLFTLEMMYMIWICPRTSFSDKFFMVPSEFISTSNAEDMAKE